MVPRMGGRLLRVLDMHVYKCIYTLLLSPESQFTGKLWRCETASQLSFKILVVSFWQLCKRMLGGGTGHTGKKFVFC